jgi:hypothetical protein
LITHIVCFKLKERGVENAQKTKDVIMSMQGKIQQLLHLEAGVDVLHSGRSYDVVLISKFDSMKDLEAYEIHPVHQEVVKYIKTVVETSVSVDFET